MQHISDHTLQINAWIALCQIDESFPNTLRRLGYVVDIIDPKFIHNEEEVNPDIILSSRGKNHSIIVDCKSYVLKEHQNDRYELVHNSPDFLISRGIVTRATSTEDFDAEFTYSSFEDLSSHPDLPENEFAVVHFDEEEDNYTIKTLPGYEYELTELQNQFPIVAETTAIPTDYFPFDAGVEKDQYQLIISILQSTVHVALDQGSFTADDLLQDAHPLWVDLAPEKRKEFRAHTEKLLQLYSSKGLDEHIRKVEAGGTDSWRVVSKSLQALQRKVDEFVEEAKAKLEQTELDEFDE